MCAREAMRGRQRKNIEIWGMRGSRETTVDFHSIHTVRGTMESQTAMKKQGFGMKKILTK
jgi:hypothetical protein